MKDILELFNCVVVDEEQFTEVSNFQFIDHGIVLNFWPSAQQSKSILEYHKPLNLNTMFSREERDTASLEELITKQMVHYIEVYGLNSPGLFNVTFESTKQVVAFKYIQGITRQQLTDKVQNLLYVNAPIKNVPQLKRIIDEYGVYYEVNKIQNNEARVVLFRPSTDMFQNGDDAVRWMCYWATGKTLLIKSREVITAIKAKGFSASFFQLHEDVLAKVFNRHKRIILAAKDKENARYINRISRFSKRMHVPIAESLNKTFLHKALTGKIKDTPSVLNKISLRDKFKLLNLIEKKKLQSPLTSYKIRNGKVYTDTNATIYPVFGLDKVRRDILVSLQDNLEDLKDKNILLDSKVDYGLPISRKQAMGNLPFGTEVRVEGNEISSGMYWENSWGATDLDLSTIDLEGNRVGWGGLSGYKDNEITFSGDLVDARDGAFEFMNSRIHSYGLFVNIYSGTAGAKMELVVGANGDTKNSYLDNPIIREKHTLESRGSVIGFVKGKKYIVYAGRLNNRAVSGDNPIINESKVDHWTVGKLFNSLNINFDIDRQENTEYDYDLTYEAFSFDKLEELFA